MQTTIKRGFYEKMTCPGHSDDISGWRSKYVEGEMSDRETSKMKATATTIGLVLILAIIGTGQTSQSAADLFQKALTMEKA
jgi:hypothetical protein